jgi:hypothetical protein
MSATDARVVERRHAAASVYPAYTPEELPHVD